MLLLLFRCCTLVSAKRSGIKNFVPCNSRFVLVSFKSVDKRNSRTTNLTNHHLKFYNALNAIRDFTTAKWLTVLVLCRWSAVVTNRIFRSWSNSRFCSVILKCVWVSWGMRRACSFVDLLIDCVTVWGNYCTFFHISKQRHKLHF